MTVWEFAVVILASYLIGSIPSGYFAGKLLKRIDVRNYGSGGDGGEQHTADARAGAVSGGVAG